MHQCNASLQGLLRPADSTSLTRIRLRARVAPEIPMVLQHAMCLKAPSALQRTCSDSVHQLRLSQSRIP